MNKKSAMFLTPAAEVRARIERVRPLIEKGRLDAAFFHYKIDYFYFSGTMQDAFLLVPLDGPPVLFVKRELKRAMQESPLEEVVPLTALEEIRPFVKGMKRVGLQLDVMPYNMVMKYASLLPGVEFADASPLAKEVRKKKSPFEIGIMEKAAAISKKVYGRIPELLREGMSEIELGGLLEAYAKPLGHEGLLRMRSLNYEPYTWHILSGGTGSIVSQSDSPMGGLGLSPAFPVGASRKKMRRGEPILVDFGINYHGYHMDLTRMYAIGHMPERFIRAYYVCRDIERKVLDRAVEGARASALYEYSVELAQNAGFGPYYLGYNGYKTLFLGHGIGVELSELPYLAPRHDYLLEEGMTFAVEPKMVFPRGGASGIEDTVLLEKNGYRMLSDVDDSIVIV
jgi:Xaa-Pro aminopeptidase